MTALQIAVTSRLLSEIETWQAQHPGADLADQRRAFPPPALRARVDAVSLDGTGDQALYVRLVELAGYRSVARP